MADVRDATHLMNGALVAAVVPLIRRMSDDLDRYGYLRRATQVRMWTAYATFGGLLVEATTRRGPDVPLGQRVVGYTLASAGAALATVGITSFATPEQLNGGETGELITGGIYDYSRNPQYAGFVAATTGLALARRSRRAALLAVELAVIMRAWVGVEERHLRRQFGAPYERLQRRVSRWIGVPSSTLWGRVVGLGARTARRCSRAKRRASDDLARSPI